MAARVEELCKNIQNEFVGTDKLIVVGLLRGSFVFIADLVRLLGEQAANPIAYYEKAWIDEEYSRGAYVGMMTPGTWSTLGPLLREPVGVIHWAGTETAIIW
ncbi:MAG: hypothetical protein EBW86_12300, partial [Rhodobacteraceae bacterium]|nr:hypothetical protein [Paracoccaceae bacterium]